MYKLGKCSCFLCCFAEGNKKACFIFQSQSIIKEEYIKKAHTSTQQHDINILDNSLNYLNILFQFYALKVKCADFFSFLPILTKYQLSSSLHCKGVQGEGRIATISSSAKAQVAPTLDRSCRYQFFVFYKVNLRKKYYLCLHFSFGDISLYFLVLSFKRLFTKENSFLHHRLHPYISLHTY